MYNHVQYTKSFSLGQNWTRDLTDEQLRELEGMERANVEARIALLRNVQQLLDTAVGQLNQYSLIIGSMG